PAAAISLSTTAAVAAPLTTPTMSPITSLQKLENRSALRTIWMACLAPGTFSAAMAWNGVSSAAADAMPIISKKTPISTSTSTTSMPAPHATPSSATVDATENRMANASVAMDIKRLQRMEWRMENFNGMSVSLADAVYVGMPQRA